MAGLAVVYVAALAALAAGLVAGGGRYHGPVAAANCLVLLVCGLALAVAAL